MTPTELWMKLEIELANDNMTVAHFLRDIKSKGVTTNIWPYRASKDYPPVSLLKIVDKYFTEDEIYEICKLTDRTDHENFALTLHPSKECIDKQRMRRRIKRNIN